MQGQIRTDLAMERLALAKIYHGRGRGVDGVSHRRTTICGVGVHEMLVETEEAAHILCKPVGKYYTISMDKMIKRCDDGFIDGAKCIATLLQKLMPERGRVLVVCLGNPRITPDAIGPACSRHIMVTRHLKEYMPDTFADFGSVSMVCPGVLGTTGIETAHIVKGAVDAVQPDGVIAVDALAARSTDRLCRTVQITDTGIEPGSGVGNRRYALSRETLGVPVISMGVPTVVDADTFIYDMTDGEGHSRSRGEGMLITPREIDTVVADSAKLMAYGTNFALHNGLTLEDIDLFTS